MNMIARSVAFEPSVVQASTSQLLSTTLDFSSHRGFDQGLTFSSNGLEIEWDNAAPRQPELTAARRRALVAKRFIDVAGALFGLVLLAPLFLIIAALIKSTDKGPVFFAQSREGLDGTLFKALKFRSMYVSKGDPTGIAQTVQGDARITPIGAFIRKTSIDELPQLINVLLGHMSLVGPRPHVPGMQAAGMRYDELVPYYGFRHLMRPGITGWAQCNGLRGPTTEAVAAIARAAHDFAYIQNFSILLDIKILLKTITSEFVKGTGH